jgi:hypothetical protein
MNVKLNCTKGMWLFLKPALAAWGVLNNYTLPSDATVESHMNLYYSDDFADDSIRGSFQGSNFSIKVRPGITNETQTWAHEFAHMIQAFNLGLEYKLIYDLQQATVGYANNKLEVQAREAGKIASLFYKEKIIAWQDSYNEKGPCSWLPVKQPKKKTKKVYEKPCLYNNWYKKVRQPCPLYNNTKYRAAMLYSKQH